MSQLSIEQRTIGRYLADLASSAPAPGGGSVAGLTGALAAGLGQMVVSLTKDAPDELVEVGEVLNEIASRMLNLAEADERAYDGFIVASHLPKSTEEEKAKRQQAMQAALLNAAQVPLDTADAACELLTNLRRVIASGNANVLSDADIAISLAEVTIKASLINVRINIPMIKDGHTVNDLNLAIAEIESRSSSLANACRAELALRRS